MDTRRSPVALALVISYVFAVLLAFTASATSADFQKQIYRSRATSAFVRRNLESRQTGMMSPSKGYYPHHMMSSGGVSSQVRRLAVAANCTSNPNICASIVTYGANATCCASTGACVQLQSDRTNCGFCMYNFAAALGCCNGVCVSTMTDNLNCGTCGTTCKNSLCTNGLCGYGG